MENRKGDKGNKTLKAKSSISVQSRKLNLKPIETLKLDWL